MSIKRFFYRYPFFIKLLSWEYWPMYIVYAPVFLGYCWYAVKARSLNFFSASNPSIETGGMFGESKADIYSLIPLQFYPSTMVIREGTNWEQIIENLATSTISFPLIAKPDRGERGWLVKKVKDEAALKAYHQAMKLDYLIQAYISYPVEVSVFYYRHPSTQRGTISSLVTKEMLQVTGDGERSIKELIKSYPRALLQLKKIEIELGEDVNNIPSHGQKVELVPLGNHSLGATFIDRCAEIDEQMTQTFDELSSQIQGFYFGRFDLRCESLTALKEGRDFSIIELNGAGAEPAHIYHPGYSFWSGQQVLFQHLKVLYEIATYNHSKGAAYMTSSQYKERKRFQKQYKTKASL